MIKKPNLELINFPDFHTHQPSIEKSIFNALPGDTLPDQCFSTGIHPWYLDESWEKEIEKIEVATENPNLIAIGECGFDLIKGPDSKLQAIAFAAQTNLAKKLGIPVILHCVKGTHLLQEFLRKNPESPAIIWHGYNQKTAIAASLLSFSVYFSFGKAILKNESNAQNWLMQCPLERIFFETDASSIPIASIYQQASLLLDIPIAQLTGQVMENWNRISKRKLR